jgi:hypothetical protein
MALKVVAHDGEASGVNRGPQRLRTRNWRIVSVCSPIKSVIFWEVDIYPLLSNPCSLILDANAFFGHERFPIY